MWLDQTKPSIWCWETNCKATYTTLHWKGWVEGTLGIPLQSWVWKNQCHHWRSEGQGQIGWELGNVTTTTAWWWRWWRWRWRRRRWATFIEGPARQVRRWTWSWKTVGKIRQSSENGTTRYWQACSSWSCYSWRRSWTLLRRKGWWWNCLPEWWWWMGKVEFTWLSLPNWWTRSSSNLIHYKTVQVLSRRMAKDVSWCSKRHRQSWGEESGGWSGEEEERRADQGKGRKEEEERREEVL